MAARATTPLIIAIDGPAGSGKSSAARLLAKTLGYLYLDTGALYRAVGWKALKEGVSVQDEEALESLCSRLELTVRPDGEGMRVYLDGRDITGEIRTPDVSRAAAAVAVVAAVRRRLLGIQRRMGSEVGARGGIVVEGRDIGTVVFPEATVKFFLNASPEVRVKRRYEELRQQGMTVDLTQTRQEIDTRDLKDSSRELAPLKVAEDAIRIDSTGQTLEDVVSTMAEAIQQKTGLPVRISRGPVDR
ncbi:MAG TPA: (d)CMP kinase [Nitrospiria bacterium]|jgi:cytidylate kinase|nr:(d)CMP kinase [Nitrospiria bacterium]